MRVSLLAAVLLLFFKAWPQHRLEKTFTMEDGLASNNLYAAFEDSKGYLWLATINGVSRFDGKEFYNFSSKDGLPDNEIFAIAEDASGRIWLSCYNGEPCYILNNRIHTVNNDSTLRQIALPGYFRFSHLGKKLILSKSVNSNYEVDETGRLRALPLQGVYFIELHHYLLNVVSNSVDNCSRYYLLDQNYQAVDSLVLPNTAAKDVYRSGEASFVIHLKDGTCRRYDLHNKRIRYLGSNDTSLELTALFYSQSQLWMSRRSGGLLPVKADLSRDPERQVVFSSQQVQNFLVDRQGNLWGCSASKGLLMSPNNGYLYILPRQGEELTEVITMSSDNTTLYLASARQLLQGRNPQFFFLLPEKLVDFYADSSHLVLATTQRLLVISKQGRVLHTLPVENIKCLSRAAFNAVYFGTHSGCFRWEFGASERSIHSGRSIAVLPRSTNEVLIGTLYGLLRTKKNKEGSWREDAIDEPAFLKNTRISCLAETDGTILVGTTQRGLLLLKDGAYEQVRLGAGLGRVNCKKIRIGPDNTIWLATYSGLFKIRLGASIHTYTVQQIRKFNGLLSDDVNDVLVYRDSVYVAGPKGITLFALRRDQGAVTAPRLLWDAIRVNGVSYDPQNPELRLPADSNSIDVHFSAIDHRSLGNILFKYRLKDLQKNWQYSTKSAARFEALAPGDYTLEVMAMNADKRWTPGPLRLSILIQPAWWQSAWFLVLAVMLGAAILNYLIRRNLVKKHREQIRRNVFQRHLAELELRAIKAQINPHFIFNSLNVIQYFINTQDNEKAEESLNRMAELLRKTLDYSDQTTVPLTSELEYLKNYLELEKLRFDETFMYSIRNLVPSDKKVEIPPMVLQPHLENALRHGFRNKTQELKKLDLVVSMENDCLLCEISDNGIGRKAAAVQSGKQANYRSRGMELSESKLRMYEAITGKAIKTVVEDRYEEDQVTASGTTIRIYICQ